MSNHNTENCGKLRRQNSGKKYDKNNKIEEEEEIVFKITDWEEESLNKLESKDQYLVDCGATIHIICNPDKFIQKDSSYDPSNHVIELADNSRQKGIVKFRGTAQITLVDSTGKSHLISLKNALCIPSYRQNIISVNRITENGLKVVFTNAQNYIITPSGTTFPITKQGRLYYINSAVDIVPDNCLKISKTLTEWHTLLGHCNYRDILKLEQASKGMKITDKTENDCMTCIEGKMTQSISRLLDAKAKNRLDLVHTDLSRPVTPISIQGCRYSICFVDDYSGLTSIYFLKSKSDAAAALKRYICEIAPYGQIKTIRSDGGGEYIGQDFQNLLLENHIDINHETSAPHSPHQNGTAERAWRSLYDMARCITIESKVPKSLWTYALRHAANVRNRCYTALHKMTPYEKFTGNKPNIGKLNLFGSICYARQQNPPKLDKRAVKGLYIGQDPSSPAHLVYLEDKRKVMKYRNVKFTNKFMIVFNKDNQQVEESWIPTTTDDDVEEENAEENPLIAQETQQEEFTASEDEEEQIAASEGEGNHEATAEATSPADTAPSNIANSRRYPRRQTGAPKFLTENYDLNNSSSCDEFDNCLIIDYVCRVENIPVTYEEAIRSSDAPEWINAMQDEMDSLVHMDTFELVPKPNKKVIKGRWVFATKNNEKGQEIFKARYVAKGFSQTPSIDYTETFLPTAKLTSIRILLQVAANENLSLHQLDVKTAYLNAPIDHEIYLEQPKGFEKYDANNCKLVISGVGRGGALGRAPPPLARKNNGKKLKCAPP